VGFISAQWRILCISVTEPTIKNTETSSKHKRQTPPTFIFSKAHALIAVDEVSAGGSVLAGCRKALVVFLFTVKTVVT